MAEAQGEATDDAALVEQMGHQVRVFQGSPRNIKVATPEDLALVEALLSTA
jgi:2-C-methyl-D-erythritol 4-phosphate cytidylyltransferase